MLDFFNWIESLPFGAAARDSAWAVAAVNVVHLLSLTVFLGALLIVDLRLLGSGLRRMPLAQLARDARPWLIGGFFGMVVTGIGQVITTPIKQYYSPHFWWKMELLVVAVLFTAVLRHRVTQADEARVGPVWGKLVAVISLGLWMTIAVFGRLIGLLS